MQKRGCLRAKRATEDMDGRVLSFLDIAESKLWRSCSFA
jgi:hypothetical protein